MLTGLLQCFFPFLNKKFCLFSATGYNDGFNAGLMKSSSSLESLEAPSHNKSSSSSTYRRRSSKISPSFKRYRVIRAYPNPDSSLYLLRTYARDVFNFTAILEGQQNVLRLWMNKPAVEQSMFLYCSEANVFGRFLLMEPSRARFLLVWSHPSPSSLPRWSLPFHRRLFSSCVRHALYEQRMSFALTLFETWMYESCEEKTVS